MENISILLEFFDLEKWGFDLQGQLDLGLSAYLQSIAFSAPRSPQPTRHKFPATCSLEPWTVKSFRAHKAIVRKV